MEKVLLDTDISSEILKRKNEAVVKSAKRYQAYFGHYTISSIAVMEIIKGFHKVNRETNIQKFISALSDTEVLTLQIKEAEIAGRIYADLERTGQPIGRADPIVASIAMVNNLILSTGNIDHYQRIINLGYDLKLENWKTTNMS